MAEDHGVFDNKMSNGAFKPVVNIAAADAGKLDIDLDIVRILKSRDGSILELQRIGLL